MKKILIASIALGLSTASFAKHYGKAGCGLGSIVMGNDGSQVLAATTNGTSYTQLFGITSGTSNCVDTAHTAENRLPLFIEGNRVALATDISRGSGETLAHLSGVLGCSDANVVGSKLQGNFREIFPSQDVTTQQINQSILQILRSDAQLAKSCAHLG